MVNEYEDVVHRQCQELDAWRDEYRALSSKNATLEQSNHLMEKELKRVREELEQQRTMNKKHYTAWKTLESRGLLARVFNRKIMV